MYLHICISTSDLLCKHHITTLDDLLSLQTHQPICLGAFTITKEQTLFAFCIKFSPLLIRHLCIRNTSKHTHVCDSRPLTTPCLFGCLSNKCTSWAPIACVHCCNHRFRPKVLVEVLVV